MTQTTDQERVSLPLDLVNDLLALCTPEDHELRERVKQAARRVQAENGKGWGGSGTSMIDGHVVSSESDCMTCSGHGAVGNVINADHQVNQILATLSPAPPPPEAIQKSVQALVDAAILEGGSPPPSQEAAMQATEQRKADLLKLLEPFIGTPLNE